MALCNPVQGRYKRYKEALVFKNDKEIHERERERLLFEFAHRTFSFGVKQGRTLYTDFDCGVD